MVNNLKTLQDGRNKTRPSLSIGEIYEYDLSSTPEELDAYCAKADFVFNLAGVNRPENPEDFMKGNFGFASDLLNCLKKHSNKATIMLSSSIQATECPYTHQDMLRAPRGVSGPGRFNWPGMGHYYFSDERVGVVKEIHKHSEKQEVIQIARIKPIKDIKMMDLSGTMRHGKKFLEFIRFPLKDMKAIAPREYLIPNFVSDCCKRLKIEGIKYYGGTDYSNYVSWHEGYFEFVEMESIEA